MAVSVAPLTTTVMSAVDDRHAGIASGINNTAARTAGLLGVAVMGIFILNAFNKSLDSRMAAIGIAPEVRELLFQLPLILLLFVLSRHSGELVSRYGAKWPLTVGPLVAAIGFVLFAIPGIGGSYWTTYFPAVAVLGLGMAVSVAPLTTTVMSAVDDRHAGIASGINNTAARTAGLLGVAVMGIFILNAFNKSLDSRMAALGIAPEIRELLDEQRINLAAAEIPIDLSSELRARLKLNIAESFLAGFRLVMFIAAGLALASAATALLMIEGKRSIRLQRKQLGA